MISSFGFQDHTTCDLWTLHYCIFGLLSMALNKLSAAFWIIGFRYSFAASAYHPMQFDGGADRWCRRAICQAPARKGNHWRKIPANLCVHGYMGRPKNYTHTPQVSVGRFCGLVQVTIKHNRIAFCLESAVHMSTIWIHFWWEPRNVMVRLYSIVLNATKTTNKQKLKQIIWKYIT